MNKLLSCIKNSFRTLIFSAGLVIIYGLTNIAHGQTVLATWNFPNDPDNAICDGGIAANAAKTISTVGGTSAIDYSQSGATTNSASATSWDGGSGTKYWYINIVTTGYYNITVSSAQRGRDQGTTRSPRDFRLEYNTGSGWVAAPGGSITVANNFTTGVLNNLALPVGCSNIASLQLRWIMTSNTSVGGSTVTSSGYNRIDDIVITGMPPGLNVIPSSLDFGFVAGGSTSSNMTYTLSGGGLSPSAGNITVSAPASFEVSLSSGSGFASSISVPYSSGTLAGTTIYARFVPASAGMSYSGNILNSGGGSSDVNVAVSGNSIASYCTSSGNTSYETSITYVSFNTISSVSAKPSGYSDYTSQETSVYNNSTYDLSVNVNTDGNYTVYAMAWIDWNGNGSFNDSGESYSLGSARNTTNGQTSLCPLSITVPAGAIAGTTRMRVSAKYNSNPTSCETGFDGEVEDYSLNVSAAPLMYYSQGADPAQLSNWNSIRAGGGSSPANFTDANQIFIIQASHSMTAGSAWSVSGNGTKLEIENGATLTAGAAVTLSALTTFQIDNGGIYYHNHNINNNIFGGVNSFDAGSTINYMLNGAQTVAPALYGNLVLSGSGVKTISGATVNGMLSMQGTATASGSIPAYGADATIQYMGSAAQTTGAELPATFNSTGGVIVNNAAGLALSGDVTIGSILTMTQGNITTGAYTLALSNSATGSLVRTSGTVIGRLRRVIATASSVDYCFPVGTGTFYRPAVMNFSSLSAQTEITAEFISSPPSGFVAYTDGTASLEDVFTEGYWRFSSSGIPATAVYSLTLTGDGFISYTLNESTRITGRDNSNTTWRAMGVHDTWSGNEISRTGITNLNTTSFDFALAHGCTEIVLGYDHERNLTIDHTKVSGGTDLYNFPLLVSISGQSFLRTSPTGDIINSNGYDITFADENYNKLDHQIEYYNGSTGDLIAWVRVPVLSVTSNTVIRMLYGNPQITADPSVTTVWDSHYKGVWHLDNNSLTDVTSFDAAGTPYNSPTYPGGMISGSVGLNGTNQWIEVINDPEINFAGNITVSAWARMNSANRDQKIAGNQNNSSGGYKFGIYTNNKVEFEIRNAANTASLNRDVAGGTVLTTGQWYYLAGVSSDVLDSIKTFVNGVSERPFKKTGTLGVASNTLTIGKEPFSSQYYFSGMFDEIRISDEVRSDGWLRTEYYNQSSPSTFYTLNDEATSCDNLPSESICTGPITLTFGYPAGGTYSGNPYITGDIFNPPSAGSYQITYTYTGGCGLSYVTKEFIITDYPAAPTAPDKEYCTSQIAVLEATSGSNIRWYSGGVLVSTANPFSTGQTVPGTYYYTVTQSLNGCESPETAVSLTIYNGVSVTTQPQPETVCAGDNASFTVTASGYNMSYQWQENGVNITDGGIYSGTATPTLTLAAPGLALSGRLYRCVITTSCGTPATSNAALLTINPLPVATFSYAGTPYCPNAANPFPTFSGGGTAGTFSSTPGLVFVSTATGQVNIAASTPGSYIITNTIAPSGGCGEVTATSPFTITSVLTWTGTGGTDWNSAANWSCGLIPSQVVSVQIPNVPNKPVLNGGASGAVNNLVIESGSSLTVTGSTLSIQGQITSDGSLTAAEGTIEMNGSESQQIGADIFSGNTVQNLIIDNPAGVTLMGPLNVSGVVSVQNGNLSSDGYLTLVSTAAGTALIDGSGTGEVTGNVTMQRYLPSGFGYKYFSSPFQASTVSEFGDEIDLTNRFPQLYRFDENDPYSGWIAYSTGTNILNPLEGYALNFGEVADPVTVDVTGIVNNGDHSVTLYNHNNPYTAGFNLVGNPFPSPVDWDGMGWTRTNIDDAVYYFRASTDDSYEGSYSSYVNGVSSDGLVSNIIPSMQGFLVHVTDGTYPVSGTLGLTNSSRINDHTSPFLKSAAVNYRFLVRATASFTDDQTSADPLVICFESHAENDFDSPYDALKLFNTDMMVTNFYSIVPSQKILSINTLPDQVDTAMYVPLGLTIYRDGEVSFRLKDVENLPADESIYFRDAQTGVNIDLVRNQEYKVNLSAGEYHGRFMFAFLKSLTDVTQPEETGDIFSAYLSGGIIKATVRYVDGNEGVITVYDVAGRPVYSMKVFEPGQHDLTTGLSQGVYIVTYSTGSRQSTIKMIQGI
jgi:hypothetical protein